MKRTPGLIVALVAAAACIAMPGRASAQQPAVKPLPPAAYLDQANQTLGAVPGKVQRDASKPLDDLRKHFAELSQAYRAQQNQIGPPLTRQDPDVDTRTWRSSFADVERDLVVLIGGGSTLGPSTTVGAQTPVAVVGTTGTMPTTAATPTSVVPPGADAAAAAGAPTSTAPVAGDTVTMANALAATKVSVVGLQDLDSGLRAQLEQFRLQLELFFAATIDY